MLFMIDDPANSNVKTSSEPRVDADQAAFEKACADYLEAAKAPDDLDGAQLYSFLQRLIHTRAVTPEQIGRKVGILMDLQHETSQSSTENQLLASIKEDLDAMIS